MIPFDQNVLNSYLSVAPELGLLVLIVIVLAYDRFVKPEERRKSGLLTAWGTLAILIGTIVIMIVEMGQGEPGFLLRSEAGASIGTNAMNSLVWGGTIRHDLLAFVFRVIFLIATLTTVLISVDVPELQKSEYYGILLMITIGLNFMGAGADLILLYVALETVSVSLYVLAGFIFNSNRSVEAGMKYFVYGSFASALMLFGFSWLYGLMGLLARTGVTAAESIMTTNIYAIGEAVTTVFATGGLPEAAGSLQLGFLLAAVMVIVGFGFKVSLVPFHFWTPDVYEGAPTAVTAFLSTASKAAGFAVFVRVFSAGVFGLIERGAPWWSLLAAMCIVTMVVGNLLAIYQSNIKRMLAYSSIAQAGYLMIGLVVLTIDGAGAMIYYLLLYVFTNIAAFGVIILVSNVSGTDEMTDLYGLSRRSPYVALVMMLALLSLGGIPPTAGFFGKFFLFKAAVDAGLWWLALIGVINAFVALYYYLNVIKYMYLFKPEGEHAEVSIPVSRAAGLGLALSTIGILVLGIIPETVFELSQQAASLFYPFN